MGRNFKIVYFQFEKKNKSQEIFILYVDTLCEHIALIFLKIYAGHNFPHRFQGARIARDIGLVVSGDVTSKSFMFNLKKRLRDIFILCADTLVKTSHLFFSKYTPGIT